MKGQNIGYVRVSSVDQNTARQLADIGIELDKTFIDKASGKGMDRPELKRCLAHLREGDTLHVHSIDRLARNLKNLQDMVEVLNNEGVTVKFHKENLTFEGSNNSPMQTLTLHLLGAFAQFERTLIMERQREGIAAAKAKGKKMGAPSKLSPDQAAEIKIRVSEGGNKSEIAKEFGISRQTLYSLIAV